MDGNSFETASVNQSVISGWLASGAKYIFLVFIVIVALKIGCKLFKIKVPYLWANLYNFVVTFKFATCLLAIFLVFFYDFENHTIRIHSGDMLLSTFLVGALAIWEIATMIMRSVELKVNR